MRVFAVSVVVAASLPACGKKSDDAPVPVGSAKPAAPPPPADAAIDAFTVWPATLEDRSANLAWHDMKATITARVPVGWITRGDAYFTIPDGGNPRPMQPSIGYSFGNRSCDGACDDGDIEKNMADSWPGRDALYAQVSYNSGNARMDNMKLDVKTLEEGALTDGKAAVGRYKAVRITRPAGAEDVPAFLERLEGTCIRHRKGDMFYIAASVIAPLEHEKLFPLLLEACKTPWFR